MTDQEANAAVAELCGWELEGSASPTPSGKPVFTGWWRSPSGFTADEPPDYGNDLNAMHEAEEKVIEPHLICEFSSALRKIVERDWKAAGKRTVEFSDLDWQYAISHATAAQRREAFLRTLGKWRD